MAENPQYHHGDLRRALIEAATDELANRPAHELSLRELARTVGVSRTAPYHHFEDKAALVHAVARESQDRFYQAQRGASETCRDPLDRLIAVGEAYVDFAIDHPNAFALVFAPEHCPGHAESIAPESPPMTALGQLLHNLVVDAQASGALPAGVPEPHVAGLWGAVHGLSSLVSGGLIPREGVNPALAAIVSAPA